MDQAAARRLHSIAVWTIAFVWIYHGAVLKLYDRDADEVALLIYLGVASELTTPYVLLAVGVAQVLFGLATLVFAQAAWPFKYSIAFAVLATIAIAATAPHYLTAAFNPVSLNALLAAMSVVALRTRDQVLSTP